MPHWCHPTRGHALTTFGALAASVALPASAQSTARLVDVHHHFYPPALMEAMQAYQTRHGRPPLRGAQVDWTPARTLEEMDRNGIATAIVEIASPQGIWFGVEPAAVPQLSRACNEFAAGMARDRPGRFGFFASLPMPNVEASLHEIAHAFDVLHADGIGLPTSFGDRWPGDPAFSPIFAELERRKAIVTLHPYAPNCCNATVPGVQQAVLEYPYDTGRAVVSLLTNGTFARFRQIRWVLPHGGGPVPALAGRIDSFVRNARDLAEIAPNGVDFELKRLYYDTANAAYGPTMAALLGYVAPSQLLFGTDFPYFTGRENVAGLNGLNLPPATLAAIQRNNVVNLLPRLRG
jgi:6-methylsalicylate decarboxylase